MKNIKIIIFNLVIVLIFFTLIWLPNLENIFQFAPKVLADEKRVIVERPSLPSKFSAKELSLFYMHFKRYTVDNFGFRNHLIRLNSLIKLKLLKIKQFPKVLIGKKDWLYLIKQDDRVNTLDYYRSLNPFTEIELKRWVKPIEDINQRLAEKGIKFIFVFAPIKHHVYPEYIPEYLKPVRDFTRLDQLKEYFKKNTNIHIVDLSQSVKNRKKQYKVFYKHDVHWTAYGSYFGYVKLVKELAKYYPSFRPRPLDDYLMKSSLLEGGDLANLLSLNDMFIEESYNPFPLFQIYFKKSKEDYFVKGSRLTEVFINNDKSLPKAVVFHDSYYNFAKVYMNGHFSRIVSVQSYNRFDYSVIEKEKPDIVIHEMVESYTMRSPAYIEPLNFYKKN